jgi:hypothetical protein
MPALPALVPVRSARMRQHAAASARSKFAAKRPCSQALAVTGLDASMARSPATV